MKEKVVEEIKPNKNNIKVKIGEKKAVIISSEDEEMICCVKLRGEYYPITLTNEEIELGKEIKELPNGGNNWEELTVPSYEEDKVRIRIMTSIIEIEGKEIGETEVEVDYGGKTTNIHVSVE